MQLKSALLWNTYKCIINHMFKIKVNVKKCNIKSPIKTKIITLKNIEKIQTVISY